MQSIEDENTKNMLKQSAVHTIGDVLVAMKDEKILTDFTEDMFIDLMLRMVSNPEQLVAKVEAEAAEYSKSASGSDRTALRHAPLGRITNAVMEELAQTTLESKELSNTMVDVRECCMSRSIQRRRMKAIDRCLPFFSLFLSICSRTCCPLSSHFFWKDL